MNEDTASVSELDDVRNELMLHMVPLGWSVERVIYDYSTTPPTPFYTLKRVDDKIGKSCDYFAPVSFQWLVSIGFKQEAGRIEQELVYMAPSGESVITWPEFRDREGQRRWTFGGKFVHPSPRNRGEVRQLLQRVGII